MVRHASQHDVTDWNAQMLLFAYCLRHAQMSPLDYCLRNAQMLLFGMLSSMELGACSDSPCLNGRMVLSLMMGSRYVHAPSYCSCHNEDWKIAALALASSRHPTQRIAGRLLHWL